MPQAVSKKSGQRKLKEKSSKARRAAKTAFKKLRAKDVQGTVSEERLFRRDGHLGRVLTLDANSATFTSDLTLMFEKNVAEGTARTQEEIGFTRAGQGA